jgi:hypothetical protein
VPLGCAPGCFAEYQEILTILPKPQPGRANFLSRLFFVNATKTSSIWFVLFAVVLETVLKIISIICIF